MIEEKAVDLGRLIGQTDEYKALRRAHEQVRDLKALQDQMGRLHNVAGDLERAATEGREPPEALVQEYDTLLSTIQGDPKYQSVIDLAKARGVSLKNVHIENDKLLIKGDAPNQAIKDEIWDEIKKVDAKYADLSARIGIDARALAVPTAGIAVYTRSLLREFAALAPGHRYFLYSTRPFDAPAPGPFLTRLGRGLAAKKGSLWMQIEVPRLCARFISRN